MDKNEQNKRDIEEFLRALFDTWDVSSAQFTIQKYGQFQWKDSEPFLARIPDDISSN